MKWWLVTFRLWRCFSLLKNLPFSGMLNIIALPSASFFYFFTFAFFQESLRFRLISAELFPLTTLVLCDGMEIQYKVDHCYCRLLPLLPSHMFCISINPLLTCFGWKKVRLKEKQNNIVRIYQKSDRHSGQWWWWLVVAEGKANTSLQCLTSCPTAPLSLLHY